jgi:hypothetical protein
VIRWHCLANKFQFCLRFSQPQEPAFAPGIIVVGLASFYFGRIKERDAQNTPRRYPFLSGKSQNDPLFWLVSPRPAATCNATFVTLTLLTKDVANEKGLSRTHYFFTKNFV